MGSSSLRRVSGRNADGGSYAFGRFVIDPAARELCGDGTPIRLPAKAFDTLLHLVRNKGRLVSKDELLAEVWPDVHVDENSVSKAVSVLRRALSDPAAERLIVTVPGRGYQFVARVARVAPGGARPDSIAALGRGPAGHSGIPQAQRLYERGRFLLAKRTAFGCERSVAYFEEALSEDPSFAAALVGLAEAHVVRAYFHYIPTPPRLLYERALASAHRALELDARLADAWSMLGWLYTEYVWDWGAAEHAFGRALELDPGNAMSHFWHARLRFLMGDLPGGLRTMHRAMEIDPLSNPLQAGLGGLCLFMRRFEDAVDQFEKALELEPDNLRSQLGRGRGLEQLGAVDEARAVFARAVEAAPGYPAAVSALGHVYAIAGDIDTARSLAATIDGGPQAFASSAVVHTALGDLDAAMRSVEAAVEDRALNLVELAFDPRLDPLRTTPGYDALLARVGLGRYRAAYPTRDTQESGGVRD